MDCPDGRLTNLMPESPPDSPIAEFVSESVGSLPERCRFPPSGTAVDCAVSGGPDSTALLVLAVAAGLEVTAWHVDHGLRPTSADEGRLVARNAASLGARAIAVEAPVEDGPSLEERARDARRAALPPGVLTGHTADDQAETVLWNLLRGSGLAGAAGIGEPHRRPLLALRRSETRALCMSLSLEVVDDPHNAETRFTRSRIRNEVMPLLADVAGRDPVPLLSRHAELAGQAAGLLDVLAAQVDPTDAASVVDIGDDLLRLAIRRWLTECADGLPPDSASVDRVLDVVRCRSVATEVVGGHRVCRSRGRLSYERR